jgi:uncharacterized oxidoreductase
MQINGNTVLITGGATGIGLALVEQFLKEENKIIICGRREDKLKEAKQKFPEIETYVCDLSKESERMKFSELVQNNFPKVNILINNAGIQREIDLTDAEKISGFEQEIFTNLIAPVHLNALFVPHLKNQQNSAIINVSSGLALTPIARMPMYCATKSAIHSYSLSLRHQLKNTSIKVFELIPPTVDTDLDKGSRDLRGQTNKGMKPDEFALLAIEALKNDKFEATIGFASNLRLKREEMFDNLNH